MDCLHEELSLRNERNIFIETTCAQSISEVVRELQQGLNLINNLIKFYSLPLKKKSNPQNSRNEGELYDGLNTLAKSSLRTIKILKRRDVTKSFSPEQEAMFQKFIGYFNFINERFGLEKDYSRRHGEIRKNPSQWNTDVKLISAAFTLAQDQEVVLCSSDSDMIRLARTFYNKNNKRNAGLPTEVNPIYFFSSFNGINELRDLSKPFCPDAF